MSIPVSCYIRTFNEEKRIAATIASAKVLTDDIVIVDSGSTDSTCEIARSMGARVVNQSWLGNGFQKRVGEDACRHNWVIDIDADEVISPELAQNITSLFESGEPSVGGYFFKIAFVPPVGRPWLSFALARRLKLYNKSIFRIPAHKAWDQIPDRETRQCPTIHGLLMHYSWNDLSQLHQKLNRVSTVRANESKSKGLLQLRLRVLFSFPLYFLRSYILRGMFRAGVYGFAIAFSLAYARWQRDAKMYEIAMLERKKS